MDIIQKKQAELQRVREAKARWWKRLSRAVTELDKLHAQERRLLKPRKLDPHELASSGGDLTGAVVHKIHDPEFFDDSDVLVKL